MNPWYRPFLFLPEQSSTFAPRADRLHAFILGITMLVAAGIGVVGLIFLIRYRRRTESDRTPDVVAPPWLEGLFIGVPLSFFLLWFVIGFNDFLWVRRAPPGALDVYVTGKQWMWKFTYASGLSSIGVLRVPAGRPVRLLITSRDVIHSFFVPDFRIKQDAIPSRYTEIWFEAPQPGQHQIFCAEYCGLDHSQMLGQVVVLPPENFESWLEQQRQGDVALQDAASATEPTRVTSAGDLAQQGERVAAIQGCLKCHTVDGSPHIGPTWLGLYGSERRLQGGAVVRADEAYLTESMMEPNAKLVVGFGPVMPSYLGKLDAPETAALVEYVKTLSPSRPAAAP